MSKSVLYDSCAGVVELVDAPDSKSGSERSVGSSPTTRTIQFLKTEWCYLFIIIKEDPKKERMRILSGV